MFIKEGGGEIERKGRRGGDEERDFKMREIRGRRIRGIPYTMIRDIIDDRSGSLLDDRFGYRDRISF